MSIWVSIALDSMMNLILREGRSVMVPPAWVAGLFGWGIIGARKLNSGILKSSPQLLTISIYFQFGATDFSNQPTNSPESVKVELGRRLEAEVTRI